jgi:FAD/FMN-containing dehydrogenase
MTRDINDSDRAELAGQFGDRLLRVRPPLQACLADSASDARAAALSGLRNPYWIEDQPGGYHTAGWLGAYEPSYSTYAVAAETSADIAAAIWFARDRGLRLAIKGTGHDYLGRSRAPGSLLVWTHAMRDVTVHDAFTPVGAPPQAETGIPAVTVGAGTRWLEAYRAVTARGRYVQGGGCLTVGAAGGFPQGGGFGSLSKHYGTAAGNLLEAEVVTADGETLVASAHQHPDLFWALRGGGGGTFGVVSSMTFRTHPMPETISAMVGSVRAASDADYRALIGALISFFPDLDEQRWGEQIRLGPDNAVHLRMLTAGVSDEQARAVWQPFLGWAGHQPGIEVPEASIVTMPFAGFWDDRWWDEVSPEQISRDDRPGAPSGNFWWTSNHLEVSWYLDAFQSRWIPRSLFEESGGTLADTLFSASRHWFAELHVNKGLWGTAPEAAERDRATSVNPAAFEAAALLITASFQQEAFPGVAGHEPDRAAGAASARRVGEMMSLVRAITPGAGSYVNETDYFEPDWQDSFWGANYPRLLEIKRSRDPGNLFRVHHGVGSE